jgi:Na+/melibiose symporter-like transporter
MEGIITVVIGVATFFLLVDTPESAGKWLKPEEVRFLVLQRFIKQGGRFAEGEAKSTATWWTDLKSILLNWRLWFINYMSFCQTAMSNATKFNLPTIVKTMGFTNTNAQLMTAPPYVAAAILVIIVSKFSDRVGWRMPFVVGPFSVCAVGFAMMLGLRGKFEENLGASYCACIIAVLGIYASTPSSTSWAAANLAPASRRAVGVAMTIAFGNLGKCAFKKRCTGTSI